jgi:hypothetical protein
LHALPGTSIQPIEPENGRYILEIHQAPAGNFLGRVVDYSPDYFQMLLDGKFITKVPLPANPPGSQPPFSAQIEAPNTPFHGMRPFDPLIEIKGRYAPIHPQVATGVPAFPLPICKLQTQASFYVHALISRPNTISQTIANLHSLKTLFETNPTIANTVRDFSFWGEVLRLQSILLNWRDKTIDKALDLSVQNASNLPFSISEIFDMIGEEMPKRLSYNGEWKFEVCRIASEIMQYTCQTLRARAAALAPDKCVPIVDQTLRKLAGYILSRGYKDI